MGGIIDRGTAQQLRLRPLWVASYVGCRCGLAQSNAVSIRAVRLTRVGTNSLKRLKPRKYKVTYLIACQYYCTVVRPCL